jgi:hypothetical protein
MRVESGFFEDAVHEFMLRVADIGIQHLRHQELSIGGRIFERNSVEILTKTRQF